MAAMAAKGGGGGETRWGWGALGRDNGRPIPSLTGKFRVGLAQVERPNENLAHGELAVRQQREVKALYACEESHRKRRVFPYRDDVCVGCSARGKKYGGGVGCVGSVGWGAGGGCGVGADSWCKG